MHFVWRCHYLGKPSGVDFVGLYALVNTDHLVLEPASSPPGFQMTGDRNTEEGRCPPYRYLIWDLGREIDQEPLKISFSSCYLNYSEPNVQFFLYYFAECLFVARITCSIEICCFP